ncbi:MAG: DUF4132 domain-containing protein [Planctomycetales bacterium]|nr:DUF4132 domain-containing protein [Planctomycetales bacterium]
MWLEADRGYSVRLAEGKLACRNANGKPLASVPKWLKDSDIAQQLLALGEWLDEHRRDCQQQVETWMLRSLPVPRTVLNEVWSDPDWRWSLNNLVIASLDKTGTLDKNTAGLLREVDQKRGLGVVDIDGETQWLTASEILIPHPILIGGLAELQEIASDMQFAQSVDQLFRPTFAATSDQQKSTAIREFQGGRFEQLTHVLSLCRRLGVPVRGGYACTKVWENGVPVEARFWIGNDAPDMEALTEDLIFVDSEQRPKMIGEVGPVTFSEGMHMATRIYAKRVVAKEEGAEL